MCSFYGIARLISPQKTLDDVNCVVASEECYDDEAELLRKRATLIAKQLIDFKPIRYGDCECHLSEVLWVLASSPAEARAVWLLKRLVDDASSAKASKWYKAFLR